MKSLVFALIWMLGLASALARENPVAQPATVEEARAWLSNYVAQPRFAAGAWGIKVVSLDSGETWFEHNAHMLFSPASNSKLYTVALALDSLGTDYRIRTSLYVAGEPDASGTLSGDLLLYGRGDPSINARVRGGLAQALQPLVHAVTNAGIRRVQGNLIADESFLKGPRYGSGWTWDDLNYYYGAEVSALTISDNTFEVRVTPGEQEGDPCRVALVPPSPYLEIENRTTTTSTNGERRLYYDRGLNRNVVVISGGLPVGSKIEQEDLTVSNPAGLFGTFLKEALERSGVEVRGRIRTVDWLERQKEPLDLESWKEIGFLESLPMGELAREVQKPSQNLYTDLLLAHVGEKARSNPKSRTTSEDLGLQQLEQFLRRAGVPPNDVHFEEGSGLSRNNLTTPNATIALLKYMSSHPAAEAYWAALPVAGVDGTLRNRMKNTPAAGKVRAKTGTLRWASSLSGDLQTAGGERLLFSLMINRYSPPQSSLSPRAAQDEIINMLVQCGRESEETQEKP